MSEASEIEALAAMAEAATPGPWFAMVDGVEGAGTVFYDRHVLHNDAAFIVAAVNYVRDMLAAHGGTDE